MINPIMFELNQVYFSTPPLKLDLVTQSKLFILMKSSRLSGLVKISAT